VPLESADVLKVVDVQEDLDAWKMELQLAFDDRNLRRRGEDTVKASVKQGVAVMAPGRCNVAGV
jgi:hypothetical protein